MWYVIVISLYILEKYKIITSLFTICEGGMTEEGCC